MLRLKIFLSDVTPPALSMVFFLNLYSRETSAFGEFSVFLVFSTIISGLLTGFFDAEILKGRRLTIQSVTRRAIFSLLFLWLAFLLIYFASDLLWQNFLLALSVAFSLSLTELVTSALIHKQKLAMVTCLRVISSSLLILMIIFIPVADPYAAYACALFASAVFHTMIFSADRDHRISPETTDRSVNVRRRFELCERVLSAFLRSVGSSPVLFATLVVGKDLAATILLAQKLLSFPMGSLLNVMVLPSMIRTYRKREQLVGSILPHSIVILTLSLAGMTQTSCFDDNIQTYTVGAFVLVGVRLYCERLIYSSFLILREARIWILTLFLLDCFVLLSLINFNALVLQPFYVLGALFLPTIVLALFLLSKYRSGSANVG